MLPAGSQLLAVATKRSKACWTDSDRALYPSHYTMSHSAPPLIFDDSAPDGYHSPTAGHLPSPIRPDPNRLIRQISFDLSRMEVIGGGGHDAAAPARPPFGRVHSPNTIGRTDSALLDLVSDATRRSATWTG